MKPPESFTWERRLGIVLAFIVVISFIYFVINPPREISITLAIIRFLAAFISGLAAFLFLGSLDIEVQLPIPKVVIKGTGAFAAFIVVFFLFLYGIPSSIISSSNNTVNLVKLSSQRGIDYSIVRDLLIEEKWQEANKNTLSLMLKATNREKEGYMDTIIMSRFPCKDLLTIERLWSSASNGKFGFRVQQEIWNSIGGKKYDMGSDLSLYKKFSKEVGWDNSIIFSLSAPVGHLPVFSSGASIGGIANTYRVVECFYNES
jgi:hypothetical protein